MFANLVGNQKTKEMMRRMLHSNRIPGALLFTGEEGLGKRHYALEIAKTFVCQSLNESEACGACSACLRAETFVFPPEEDKKKDEFKRVIYSGHIDVGTVIPYKKNILVDAIRDLEKESNFRPYEAKARIFIIDQAEKMNLEASNALLKTLEEPSPTSYIFLVTSRPMSLLPTIRSRCQTIHFVPLEAKEIEDHLVETKKYSGEDAALLARISRGSIGRALSIPLEKFVTQRELAIEVLQSVVPENNIAKLLRSAEEINSEKNKADYEQHLEILQTLIQDIWQLKQGQSADKLINADMTDALTKIASRADANCLAQWQKDIENLRENLNVNLNRKIATDALFMKMANV